MREASKAQIQKLHVLLKSLDLVDEKEELVYTISDGRTTSSKELSMDEARRLIMNLAEYDPRERQKSLIFSLAYRAGIIYGETDADKKINVAKLNMFLKERGAVKKELNRMTQEELVKVHRQFEGIVRNNKRSRDRKEAKQAVSYLLKELNINTAKR